MTIGKFQHIGDLNVTGNMRIQNFDGAVPVSYASIVDFKNGKAIYQRKTNEGNWGDKSEFYSNTKVADMIKELSKLDGNDDLSIADLRQAERLKGFDLGYKDNNVYDHKEYVASVDMSKIKDGIITLKTTFGYILHIDAETEDEKATADAKAAAEAKAVEEEKAATKAKADAAAKAEAERKKNSPTIWERLENWGAGVRKKILEWSHS